MPPPAAPIPVYPIPAMAFQAPTRRQPERGLDGLLIAAWVLSMGGLMLAVVGIALLAGEFAAAQFGPDEPDLVLAGVLATVGALLILAGLSAGSVRAVILRRNLGEDRYRGPAPLALLAIWIVASNLASVPFLGDILEGVQGDGGPSTSLGFALIITPATLALVTALFVLLPRALPGVRFLERNVAAAAWNFVLGILIGAPAWLVGTLIAVLASEALSGLGLTPDALPVELLEAVDPVLLVVALVIAAPIGEELFFRGVLFNAWEREYGFWRALIGSSVIFAAIHLSLFSLVPFLVLAFVLGYAYARTRSLLTVIAIHATFNAISTAYLLSGVG